MQPNVLMCNHLRCKTITTVKVMTYWAGAEPQRHHRTAGVTIGQWKTYAV